MRQLSAFIKKEFMEQLRTGRFIILSAIFLLFGIMNPAMAKLTPWMMEVMSKQLEESGMTVTGVTVDAMTSWNQFFKNMPMVLIIFVVMFSGILTVEYQKGTLINVVTKGLKRWKIIVAKAIVMTVIWIAGCLMSYGITYGYNAYFWDNKVVSNVFFAAFCFFLTGLWLISVMVLGSVFVRSSALVSLFTGGAFILSYVAGIFPDLKRYSPSFLMDTAKLLTGGNGAGDYVAAIAVTVVLIGVNIIGALAVFQKRSI